MHSWLTILTDGFNFASSREGGANNFGRGFLAVLVKLSSGFRAVGYPNYLLKRQIAKIKEKEFIALMPIMNTSLLFLVQNQEEIMPQSYRT